MSDIRDVSEEIRVPLNRALYILLYDQFESAADMDLIMDDKQWVNCIVSALIEKNDAMCPFKNYGCERNCESSIEKCKDGLSITCDLEREIIWKKFMLF